MKSGYQIRLEGYSGDICNITLKDQNAVRLFLQELPNRLNKGVRLSYACDVLAIGGVITGRKVLD